MISHNVNVKSAFRVKKLYSIPRIRELATHDSHGKYKRKETKILSTSSSNCQ